MNVLPCINTMHADNYAAERGREELRESALNDRIDQLKAEMWQDPAYLSDAVADASATIGWYRKGKASHPDAMTFLTLLRDGSDDLELARMLREAAKDYIADEANRQADEEFEE